MLEEKYLAAIRERNDLEHELGAMSITATSALRMRDDRFMLLSFAGCTPATNASHNISAEADKFGITRRITVVNMRTDKVMFEIEGTFSLKNNTTKELEIICMIGPDTYKKHFVYLNDWTSYVMEDISGADIDPYGYNIKIYPKIPEITIGG